MGFYLNKEVDIVIPCKISSLINKYGTYQADRS